MIFNIYSVGQGKILYFCDGDLYFFMVMMEFEGDVLGGVVDWGEQILVMF